MIPKIIHYCWFGRNPLPPLALECIASWKKYLPDYEIKEWNEDNFDVNIIPYTAEAYKQKRYAYVSDYARFWIMYKYGGIYFDTDVEVIRPMDDIIEQGSSVQEVQEVQCSRSSKHGFMGFEMDPDGENTPGKYAPRFCFDVALGLGFGMEPQHPFMNQMMEYYQTLKFELPPADISWYKTIVAYTTEKLCEMGLRNVQGVQEVQGVKIYPSEYFAPINSVSRRLHITSNTRTIHRYMSSWSELNNRSIKDYIRHYMPEWMFFLYNRIKRQRYKISNPHTL